MTTLIIKDSFRSAFSRPIFLILLVITLLMAPASAFASGDDSTADDSSLAAEEAASTDQSGGSEESTSTEQFESPTAYEQDAMADSDNIVTDYSAEISASETPSPSSSPSPLDEQSEPAENTGVGNSYTAEITSEEVVATGTENTSFTVMFTEIGDKTLGSIQLTLPEGFSAMTLDYSSIQAPEGKNWTGGVVDLVLKLWAEDAGSYLVQGESVSATFTATTPEVPTGYTFATEAWTDNSATDVFDAEGSITNTNNMATGYSDPMVFALHQNSPFNVSEAAHLDAVRNGLTYHYIQTANIDLGPYLSPGGAGHNNWGDAGWLPIGSVSSGVFFGKYDGNGHTITNLYINRPDENHIGLFGYTGSGAVLQNIKLENVDITGRQYVGGLVGLNHATIKNSYATGEIEGKFNIVGGLVGENFGKISNSYATVEINGSNSDYGGLVGKNRDAGIIENCYATGDVNGYDRIGGLVGKNEDGTISNSYAAGAVTGGTNVGGLIGYNGGTIENSYAAGAVTGSTNVGGLVGYNASAITNSYWNIDVNGIILPGVGDGDDDDVYGKTTAELQTLAFHQTTLGWDITGQDGFYPVLGWQVNWIDNIWYMGTPPVDDGSGGRDFGSYDFDFASELLTQLSTGLTTLTGQSNAVITPGIIAYGSWNDFYQASAAYQVALEYLESNRAALSPVELALLEVELAIARAAILAMEARLLSAEGLPYNMAALQAAYAAAVASLSAHQSFFLSAGQLAAANQLLAAIAGVIAALQ